MLHLPALTVTAYCERTGPGFWAEPLNAISNVAFMLVAALILLRLWKRHYPLARSWDLWLLAGLIGVTGIGSFLWHSYARPWAEWMDVVPILVYISIYLLSFLLRIAHLSLYKATVWFVVFHATNILFVLTIPGTVLNGSIFYIPSLGMLILLMWYERKLFRAVLFFTFALIFRTIDHAVCPLFPHGTHFLWHLLISVTVYITTSGLLNETSINARKHV